MNPLTIIKVGGKIVEEPSSLEALLQSFYRIEGSKILVHGGGTSATRLAEDLGIETTMIEGRRVTDFQMLKIVTMVYAGWVNKNIVVQLQSLGCNSIGLCGADLGFIESVKRADQKRDWGYVGDVKKVNTSAVQSLIEAGVTPIVAPITFNREGNLLNTNADTVAAAVAKSFAKDYQVKLVYCFEKQGVLSDPYNDSSVISHINPTVLDQLKAEGAIQGGMIPKIDNAFDSLRAGVYQVCITNASDIECQRGTTVSL